MIHHQGRVLLLSSVHLQNIFWWSLQKNESRPFLEILWRRSNKTRQIQI